MKMALFGLFFALIITPVHAQTVTLDGTLSTELTNPDMTITVPVFSWPDPDVSGPFGWSIKATWTSSAPVLGTAFTAQSIVETGATTSGAVGGVQGGVLIKGNSLYDSFGVLGIANNDPGVTGTKQAGVAVWGLLRGETATSSPNSMDAIRATSEVEPGGHPQAGLLVSNHTTNWFDAGVWVSAAGTYGMLVGPQVAGPSGNLNNPTYPFAYRRYTGGGLANDFYVDANGAVHAAPGQANGFYVGATQVLRIDAGNAYTNLNAPNGDFIFSGGGTDPTNYYEADAHMFRKRDHSTVIGKVDVNGVEAAKSKAIPAGGSTGVGVKVSSTANFGVFFGSGAPTLSAAKGSLYMRSDGSTTNNRAYVNTDGGTTWTALTTAN